MRLDREYLQTGTRYPRSENGVENSDHSVTRLPILVQFGPQTAKNHLIIFVHYIVIMLDASIDAGATVVGGRGWAAGLSTRPLKHGPVFTLIFYIIDVGNSLRPIIASRHFY